MLLQYSAPKNYPVEELSSNGLLGPITIAYHGLNEAVAITIQKLQCKVWGKKTAMAYLRVQGINKDAITKICGSIWEQPSMWTRGTQLTQHIDVPMHLKFLGVVKTSILMVQEWMTKRHKNNTFLNYTVGCLEFIQKMGLSWCKCIEYKAGKFGGWVSENYLAIARLLPWFYGAIEHIATDRQFADPVGPQKRWTKLENHTWLMIRALDTKGNAAELRDRVHYFMHLLGGPPPIAPSQTGPIHVC
jgi:hypothetical protein